MSIRERRGDQSARELGPRHHLVPFVVFALLPLPGGSPGVSAAPSSAVVRSTSSTSSTSAPKGPIPGAESRPHLLRTTFFDSGVRLLTVGTTTTPVRSWGLVSAPTDGRGPFPLAIILHGAHAFCASGRAREWPCPEGTEVPNHDGLSWLAEALARQGFVAVAIGMNAEFARPADQIGAVTAALVERDVLGPLSVPRAKFASWLDPVVVDRSDIILIGHSRGGAVAAVLGRGDPARRLSAPVAAAMLIAPTSDTVSPELLADVPTAVVIGSCDGDSGVDGGEFLTAAMRRVRRSPIALFLMRGATHNAVNERLRPEPPDRANPDCADDVRLGEDAQRSQLADLVPRVIRALKGNAAALAGAGSILDVKRADDRIAPGIRLVQLDPTIRRRSLLEPSAGWPNPNAKASGLRVVGCPAGMSSPFLAPGTESCHRVELTELVGRPASLHLDWTAVGGTLRLSHRRLPAGAVLVLRAFADPLSVGPGSAITATVTGSDPGQALPPWSAQVRFPTAALGEPIAEAGLRRGAVLWSERRIVLPAATSMTTLTITGPASGALDVVGVESVSTR